MFTRHFRKLPSLALAVMIATSATTACSAQDTATAEAEIAAAVKDDQTMLQIADDAHLGLRDIRVARISIFNGAPDDALTYAQAALANFDDALKMKDTLQVDTRKDAPDGDAYLPFDTSLMLAEGFLPTEEKAEKIDKANGHIANGETDQALETLKLAEVDVTLSAALVPAQTSRDHIADAVSLIRDGKFYEANLALKAVEDSVIIESYSVDTLPEQGE